MIRLQAQKAKLRIVENETITSGSVNSYHVQFLFSPDWNGLTKTAVFRAGEVSRSVPLGPENEAVIPREILTVPGSYLMIGVFGKLGEEVVLPSVWADAGRIIRGVPSNWGGDHATDLWEEKLDQKGDALEYDGQTLSLMSGDTVLSSVEITGGSGPGFLTDQNSGRPVKVWFGTVEEYNALETVDPDVCYNILEGAAYVG